MKPLERGFDDARAAAAAWRGQPVAERLRVVRAFRRLVADRSEELAACIPDDRRASRGETLVGEVLPLLDACRFLERRAKRLLRPRRLGLRGRPLWLTGVRSEIRREPWGVVLVIGPANYPLMLPGIQALQALAAGNAVVWKPAPGGEAVARKAAALLAAAGLPADLLFVTDGDAATGAAALDAGPDRVLLTGSYETGRRVVARLAGDLVPATVELSGCDAAFVLDDADVELTARALAFGVRWNGGATCIAPRRVFVARGLAGALEERLAAELREVGPYPVAPATRERLDALVRDACAAGARLAAGDPPGVATGARVRPLVLADATAAMAIARSDVFAPAIALIPVDGPDAALDQAARCPYALGASVFGSPRRAHDLAARIDAGVVVVNDMIVPTADPRLPFGGRGRSGYGVTRGAEGLLELTRPKVVTVRRGRFRPHFDPPGPRAERWLPVLLRIAHGSAGPLRPPHESTRPRPPAELECATGASCFPKAWPRIPVPDEETEHEHT